MLLKYKLFNIKYYKKILIFINNNSSNNTIFYNAVKKNVGTNIEIEKQTHKVTRIRITNNKVYFNNLMYIALKKKFVKKKKNM